jgi:hypothetical protein
VTVPDMVAVENLMTELAEGLGTLAGLESVEQAAAVVVGTLVEKVLGNWAAAVADIEEAVGSLGLVGYSRQAERNPEVHYLEVVDSPVADTGHTAADPVEVEGSLLAGSLAAEDSFLGYSLAKVDHMEGSWEGMLQGMVGNQMARKEVTP